jgi:uncharacterized protein DUF1524
MQYAMFLVVREIRGKRSSQLVEILSRRLAGDAESFATNDRFRLHGMNGRQIHRLLARLTDYVERMSGLSSRYTDYVGRKGQQGFEVEHIWANHPERHKDEFEHQSDFDEYRNRIGGLLLLQKSFNASFGDLPFAEKRGHYLKQNLLAQSLHENAYEHNPGFLRFIKEHALPLQPHHEFKKKDLDARQALYQRLAEELWNPLQLETENRR